MAEAGLFVGWGQAVRGREDKALQVFGDSMEYWSSQQANGRLESFEVVLLGAHGGDLFGFALLRGSYAQIAELRGAEDFQRLIARAASIVDGLGVIDAVLGDGIGPAMTTFQEVIAELT